MQGNRYEPYQHSYPHSQPPSSQSTFPSSQLPAGPSPFSSSSSPPLLDQEVFQALSQPIAFSGHLTHSAPPPFDPSPFAVPPSFEPSFDLDSNSSGAFALSAAAFDQLIGKPSSATASLFGTPSYRSESDFGGGGASPNPFHPSPAQSVASSFGAEADFETRYQQALFPTSAPPFDMPADPLFPQQATMSADSTNSAEEEMKGVGTSKSGAPTLGRSISEPERDATMTIPRTRRREASPFGARQDTQRPFAFKRASSGFSSYINFAAASPTSDLRTRPSTPAVESATRSTFGTAVSDSPPSSSAPFFTASPSATLAPLEIPSAPALHLTGPTPETARPKDRPKGQGTLELERVLGMWAAKTPTTSSFPNLPPLSSSSSAPNTSQPLFTQTVLASEPESFVPSFSKQPVPDATSALVGDLPQAAPSFTATLAAPRETPRRQRSKSEADIFRLDTMLFGTNPAPPQPLPIDFAQRFLSSSAYTQSPTASAYMALDPVDVHRPPSAPTAYTTATPSFATLNLDSEQHELTTRERPSLGRPHPSFGGPGYHEAALLDVSGYQQPRRARSQGLGHRRTAKSDDFTHLWKGGQQDLYEQATTSADGRLAPPSNAGQPAVQVAPSPPLPPAAASPVPAAYPASPAALASSPHLGGREPLVQGYLANGQPVLVPASYISPAPPPSAPLPSTSPAMPQGQYLAASAYPSHFPPPLPPAVSPPHPQQQAQGQGLQYYPYPAPSSHRGSVSSFVGGGSPSLMPTHTPSPAAAVQPSPPPPPPVTAAGTSAAHAMAAAAAYAALHPQRSPYVYHSPLPPVPTVPTGQLPLPSPPTTAALAPSPGGRSGRSSRGSASAAGDLAGEEDAEGEEEEEEEEDEEIEEDDGSGEYGAGEEDRKPRILAAAAAAVASSSSGAPLAKAPKKKKAAAVKAGSPGEDYSKESKTTQATIDAAKRRRNSNAVAKFVCELCGETFTRRYNLRGHQRAHAGEKPYKCSYEGCDKAFARAHDCKRHELLHLGVRKYHCSPCKRDFVRLDALHRHHRSEVGQACVKQLQAEGYTFDEKGAVSL
ncbi:hypothetical protein JCM11251_002692 [Rhodosporidiobolus azoricus]